MKRSTKIAFGISAVAVAGFIVYAASSVKTRRMLKQVSNEGYETAYDVLYPQGLKSRRKLRIGPVIPKKRF